MTRDQLLLKLGAAKNQVPAAWRLVKVQVPDKEGAMRPPTFTFTLRRDKLCQVRRREGHYLLRSDLSARATEKLWQFYIQLTQVEAAFKDLKDDLSLRPIFHSSEQRIEAHIFVSFLAYGLHVVCGPACGCWHPARYRARCWRSLPPSRCWTCISPPATGGNWRFAVTLSRTRTTRCSWHNWVGTCRPNPHHASPRKASYSKNELGADLFEPTACLQPLTLLAILQLRKSG